MNEFLQNVMTFINEHTLLLIGICVFLILVLIGYLIDNSVKSKRIRKDIKNKDQVPKNIKEEIIKEAEEKGEIKISEEVKENINVNNETKEEVKVDNNAQVNVENTNVEPSVEVSNAALDANLNLNSAQAPAEPTFNIDIQNEALDNSLNLDSSLKVEDANLDKLAGDTTFDTNINLDSSINLTDKQADTLNFGLDSGIISNDMPTIDPDADIMSSVINPNSGYANDKKLSEILSENNSLNISQEVNNSNETPLNIEINADLNSASNVAPQDELDQIMQKLSSLKNDTEEDNYTNIF